MSKCRFLCFIIVSCWGAEVNGQVTSESAAVQVARTFLQRVEPEISPGVLSLLSTRRVVGHRLDLTVARWSVSGGDRIVSLDEETGAVKFYSNSKLYSAVNGPDGLRLPRSGPPFYRNEADLITRAKRKLEAIGWAFGPDVSYGHRPIPVPDAHGNIGKVIICLKLHDRPNGYSTLGAGNRAIISLDSLTGEIVELQRFIGYTYAPPTVNITSEQAVQAAREVIDVGPSPTVLGPAYQCLIEWGPLSERGRALYRSKTMPLGYWVHGLKEDAVVASDTGEILNHYPNATGGEEPDSAANAATTQPPTGRVASDNESAANAGSAPGKGTRGNPMTVVLSSAAALLVVAGAIWAFRHAHR